MSERVMLKRTFPQSNAETNLPSKKKRAETNLPSKSNAEKNTKAFCIELLHFLGKRAQYGHSLLSIGAESGVGEASESSPFKDVDTALEALRNVLKADPGLETQCIGHFKLLFTYLRVDSRPELQLKTLEVISLSAANQECVSDIAASNTLLYLFLLLHSMPQGANMVLFTLFTLSSNGKIAKDALELGGLMYILDVLCNSDDVESRNASAEVLGKLEADKLTGPRWTQTLLRFLPLIFSEAARDSPAGCVQLFDTVTENPELIWNDVTRNAVKRLVAEEASRLYEKQKDDPEYTWKMPENMTCAYEDIVSGEFVVGGVFVRLFIENPMWDLRQPRQFLMDLLEQTLREMRSNNPNGDVLETLSYALTALLQQNPSMTDQIATQGYVPQVVEVMGSLDRAVARGCILLFQQMTKNDMCAEKLHNMECISRIMGVMKVRKDYLHPAFLGLRALFKKDNASIIEQALRCNLVEFLLSLLGSSLVEVDNAKAVRAEIVDTLKAMTINLEFGGKVKELLTNSIIWATFKDQHLGCFPGCFCGGGSAAAAGYLTQGLAGYLTQGSIK